jgi:hypothetical protein
MDQLTKKTSFGVFLGLVFVGLYLFWVIAILPWSFDDNANKILQEHYSAIIGLPTSAALSFILVVILRQTTGPIEFEGLGFKFKGASGEVVMWVACFLPMVGAIKLLW